MLKRSTSEDGPDPSGPTCREEDHGRTVDGSAAFSDGCFEHATRMLRAVGDESRLRLLELLRHGELCVTEIAAVTGEGMSTISQRLRVLRGEGLVSGRREGKHVYYSLADGHVEDLILNVLSHASHDAPAGEDQRYKDDEKGTER